MAFANAEAAGGFAKCCLVGSGDKRELKVRKQITGECESSEMFCCKREQNHRSIFHRKLNGLRSNRNRSCELNLMKPPLCGSPVLPNGGMAERG